MIRSLFVALLHDTYLWLCPVRGPFWCMPTATGWRDQKRLLCVNEFQDVRFSFLLTLRLPRAQFLVLWPVCSLTTFLAVGRCLKGTGLQSPVTTHVGASIVGASIPLYTSQFSSNCFGNNAPREFHSNGSVLSCIWPLQALVQMHERSTRWDAIRKGRVKESVPCPGALLLPPAPPRLSRSDSEYLGGAKRHWIDRVCG